MCAYHHSFYRPDNLCLIVTGQVEPERLFEALAPFEERVLGKVRTLPTVSRGSLVRGNEIEIMI